ncbi:DUF3100 domain-containing protein [Methanosphaera sp.]
MNKKSKQNNCDLFNYKIHISVLLCAIIAESIGITKIAIYDGINFIILPLVYSLILAILLYLIKPYTWIQENESKTASKLLVILIGPLIAKLAISSGQNFTLLMNIGPGLLLEELGDIGCIFIALPIALLLGFKRESIGMASSICREPQMAVIIDKYGFESQEVKGFMAIYLIGSVLGTIIITIIANVFVYIIPLHPYAYAMACGVGSASMNVAAVSALQAIYPELAQQLYAFSGISNLISVVFSLYIYIFILLPLTEKLYNILHPIIDKYIFKR